MRFIPILFQDKMDIKKDKAGLVFVKGAVVKQAKSEAELQTLFDEGSKNRHVASTSMSESKQSCCLSYMYITNTLCSRLLSFFYRDEC